MFADFFDVEDANATVDDGRQDGAGEVRDLYFASVESGVVRWEGVRAF